MIEPPTAAKRPRILPNMALSKVHLRLCSPRPGGLIRYACTNSAGGEPSTFTVPDSSQHSGRCAISVRLTVSSGSPSARHSVPVPDHTAGSKRNVWLIATLWRRSARSRYVAKARQGVTYVDGTYLVGELAAQLPLPHRLCGDGRGPRRRSSRVAPVPRCRRPARLADHPDPQYPRAQRPHRR